MDHHTTSNHPAPPPRIPDQLQALSDTPLTGDPADRLRGTIRSHRLLTTRLTALPSHGLLDFTPGPDGHPEADQHTYTLGDHDGHLWHLRHTEEDLYYELITPQRRADLDDLARN